MDAFDRWHDLLNARFVCQACMTRFYSAYHICPACHQMDTIQPLHSFVREWARTEEEYRWLIAAGQDPMKLPAEPPPELDYAGPDDEGTEDW